jgi:soluble lytic murein transglycosylase-like protein
MVESSGNKNAYAESSGALGLYQFVPKTWESMVNRYMPELKQQKGDYMEFRRNPEVSRYMARKLMEENQNILKKKGFNDTKGNLYLAHFAGPGAALSVLKAKPNTRIEDVLSAGQIQRNPGVFNKVKTTDQLIKWAQSKILLEKFKKKR